MFWMSLQRFYIIIQLWPELWPSWQVSAAPRNRDVNVSSVAAAWEAQATRCRFTHWENLQPISVPFTSIRNMLRDTTIYSFQKGSMATKTQSQLICLPCTPVKQPQAAASPEHPLPLTLCSPLSEGPVLHHDHLLHNPKISTRMLQQHWLNMLPFVFSPARSEFLFACFLSLGLRFRHSLIIPRVFSRDQVKNYILLMFWTSQR